VQVYDAITKRWFKLKYNMNPWDVDKCPASVLDIWKLIENELEEKDKLNNNGK
jgi:hypothetical protein